MVLTGFTVTGRHPSVDAAASATWRIAPLSLSLWIRGGCGRRERCPDPAGHQPNKRDPRLQQHVCLVAEPGRPTPLSPHGSAGAIAEHGGVSAAPLPRRYTRLTNPSGVGDGTGEVGECARRDGTRRQGRCARRHSGGWRRDEGFGRLDSAGLRLLGPPALLLLVIYH